MIDAPTAFLIALVVAALLMAGLCWAAGLIDKDPPEENTKDDYSDRR